MDFKTMTLEEKGKRGIFDGEAARLGYALNKMCHSFNREDCRQEFLNDPEGYYLRFGLSEAQLKAARSRRKDDFVAAGGSLYFFNKFIRMFPEAGDAFAYEATVKTDEGA